MSLKTNGKRPLLPHSPAPSRWPSTGASLAQAQGGGTVAPAAVAPAPGPASATAAGSWTVYKKATWYGPGFWGNETACGMMLEPTVVGIAHKKLPCGTQVTFSHDGRSVTATVIDRGPYTRATPGT